MAAVSRVSNSANVIGESPVWDARNDCLWWIDIAGPSLHRYDLADKRRRDFPLGEQVGAIAVRTGGGLVAATRRGFSFLDPSTAALAPIVDALGDAPDVSFNDGRCDRRGRFWVGTIQEKRKVGAAELYRLGTDRNSTRIFDGITVANGTCWSPDDRTMYFADSYAGAIYAFDFDADEGAVSNRRLFAQYPKQYGAPDGATVDAEGNLWSAGFGGWHVLKFAPDGALLAAVKLPVSQPTSCTFGGPGLATLFVTTARLWLDEDGLRQQPLAGDLLAFEPGTSGVPDGMFAG